MVDHVPKEFPRLPTGIPGLDDVLRGGVPEDLPILVCGRPGTGKTTVGLQFLREGARRGEASLLVTNAESPGELDQIAASHGWSLQDIEVWPWREPSAGQDDYTLLPAAEVEVSESLELLFTQIEKVRPCRLVIDSISGLRGLARDASFYRRQIQKLRDFVIARSCTTLLIDDDTRSEQNLRTQTVVNGVLELEQHCAHFGRDRRRLRIRKMRGCRFETGYHDFRLETGGLIVYPCPESRSTPPLSDGSVASSASPELDALAGGGLQRGSSTLFLGPSGCGKSTLTTLYLFAAAQRGERAAIYLFDEGRESFLLRNRGIGLDISPWIESETISIHEPDQSDISPGQLRHQILEEAARDDIRLLLIDTLNGFFQIHEEDQSNLLFLRELLSHLGHRGILTMMTLTQPGILGTEMRSPVDLSFIADNVFLLRFFEARGAIHRALSMVKRRVGNHERTIRELRMKPGQVSVGEPLTKFRGVMLGVPTFLGDDDGLGEGED